MQTVDRIVELGTSNDPERVAGEILKWLVEEKSWDAVDDLLAKHQDRFTKASAPLYWAALARQEQGKTEQAEQLAEQASRLEFAVHVRRLFRRQGTGEFAASSIGPCANIDVRSTSSRWPTARSNPARDFAGQHAARSRGRQGSGRHARAARQGACTDDNLARQYTDVSGFMREITTRTFPIARALTAQFHFYRACQYAADKDWKQPARRATTWPSSFDTTDADVLIAMYRVPGSGRAEVAGRHTQANRRAGPHLSAGNRRRPRTNRTPTTNGPGSISNTEGDFQKAIATRNGRSS